ncbi:hypothetical protein D9M69_693920 [compost metagenome]
MLGDRILLVAYFFELVDYFSCGIFSCLYDLYSLGERNYTESFNIWLYVDVGGFFLAIHFLDHLHVGDLH